MWAPLLLEIPRNLERRRALDGCSYSGLSQTAAELGDCRDSALTALRVDDPLVDRIELGGDRRLVFALAVDEADGQITRMKVILHQSQTPIARERTDLDVTIMAEELAELLTRRLAASPLNELYLVPLEHLLDLFDQKVDNTNVHPQSQLLL